MSIYDKWNKAIGDVKQFDKEVKEAEANGGGEYKEVPVGEYEVKVDKMELKESSKGDPMVSIQFRILEGDFKKSCLFFNQVVTKPFQISIVNSLLRSLDTDLIIEFNGNYEDYANMILDMFEEIDKDGLEYLLAYGKRNGFNTFKVKEVFSA